MSKNQAISPIVRFREAEASDAAAIAQLHANSWRSAYRGIFSDDYLDNHAYAERSELWQARFAERVQKPFLAVLAEIDSQLNGFACVFPNEHTVFGSFLDNLHILPQRIGQGIGRDLLRETARLLLANGVIGGLYLWLIEQNIRARQFYKSAGGVEVERAILGTPDGGQLAEVRCHWFRPPQPCCKWLPRGINKVILACMKTAVSIPDPLFNAAERVSRRLGVSRSRFYAMAIEKILESDGRRGVKETLDQVYSEAESGLDAKLAKMQSASVAKQDEKW
jgi:GNAT superfamily N-acetyltransferase